MPFATLAHAGARPVIGGAATRVGDGRRAASAAPTRAGGDDGKQNAVRAGTLRLARSSADLRAASAMTRSSRTFRAAVDGARTRPRVSRRCDARRRRASRRDRARSRRARSLRSISIADR
eukprot:30886-Pelagococcus_subviridis.AAC.5